MANIIIACKSALFIIIIVIALSPPADAAALSVAARCTSQCHAQVGPCAVEYSPSCAEKHAQCLDNCNNINNGDDNIQASAEPRYSATNRRIRVRAGWREKGQLLIGNKSGRRE